MDKPVILRDVLSSDIAVFFEHQADEQASKMAAFPIRDVASHAESWDRRIADPSVTARTIVWGEEVVGYVVAWESDGKHEVGYRIGRDYWGRGMATTTLTRFLDLETLEPAFGRSHGVLQRRPVAITAHRIKYIGKESNQLEEVEAGIHDGPTEVLSQYTDPLHDVWTDVLQPALVLAVEQGLATDTQIASHCEVNRSTVGRWRKGKTTPYQRRRESSWTTWRTWSGQTYSRVRSA